MARVKKSTKKSARRPSVSKAISQLTMVLQSVLVVLATHELRLGEIESGKKK